MLTAKWPLVLTANQAPLWLRESPACHIRPVEPCPTPELALLLGMIWAAEGLPALAPAAFTALARSFVGDVRSAIMNLQVWASRLPDMLEQQQQQQQQLVQAPPELPSSSLPLSPPSSSSPSLSLSPPAAAAISHTRVEEGEDEGEEAVFEVSHRAPAATAAAAAAAAEKAPIVFGYRCPAVKSVRPFSGRLVGGTRITIKGQHFLQRSDEAAGTWAPVEVLLGHMPCLDVKVLSDDEIKAITPPCPPSLSSAANGQFPVVVRVSRFASNEAVRQLACHSSFRYQNKQRCIDELFPELRVPKHRLKRPVAALSDQQEEEEEEGEGEEWDEGGMQQGREAEEGEGGHSPEGRRSGSESEDGKGGQAKRRKVVLESDDDENEDEKEEEEKESEAKETRALPLNEGGEKEDEDEEEGGALTTTPTTTGTMALLDGDGSAKMVVGTTEWEEEEQDAAATAATAAVAVEEVVEAEEEYDDDAGSAEPERVWREMLKPPCFEGRQQVDTTMLATLNEHAEALSSCDLLRAFAPGLDGDDYLQVPCSSLLRRGVTAQVSIFRGGGFEKLLLQRLYAEKYAVTDFLHSYPTTHLHTFPSHSTPLHTYTHTHTHTHTTTDPTRRRSQPLAASAGRGGRDRQRAGGVAGTTRASCGCAGGGTGSTAGVVYFP